MSCAGRACTFPLSSPMVPNYLVPESWGNGTAVSGRRERVIRSIMPIGAIVKKRRAVRISVEAAIHWHIVRGSCICCSPGEQRARHISVARCHKVKVRLLSHSKGRRQEQLAYQAERMFRLSTYSHSSYHTIHTLFVPCSSIRYCEAPPDHLAAPGRTSICVQFLRQTISLSHHLSAICRIHSHRATIINPWTRSILT